MEEKKPEAKTAAERKREERARKAAAGITTVAVDIPSQHVKWFQQTAAQLRKGGSPPGIKDPVPLEIRTVEVPMPIPGPVEVQKVRVEVPFLVPRLDWKALLVALTISGGACGAAGWWGHGFEHPKTPPPPYGVCEAPAETVTSGKQAGRTWCWMNVSPAGH